MNRGKIERQNEEGILFIFMLKVKKKGKKKKPTLNEKIDRQKNSYQKILEVCDFMNLLVIDVL